MNKFVRKASETIKVYLKNTQVSIENNILYKYVRKDDDPLDGAVDFNPTESYIEWQIKPFNNGIGQITLDVKVINIVLKGQIEYEIEQSQESVIIPVEIPINKNNIKIDINMNNNTLELGYIDVLEDSTYIIFSSIE